MNLVCRGKLAKICVLFLFLVFSGWDAGEAGALGAGSFPPPAGYIVSESDSGSESVRFLTNDGEAALDGKSSFFRYYTSQKKPYTAKRILDHYTSLLKRAGGDIVQAQSSSLGGKNLTGRVSAGGVETWIFVEVKDLRTYEVSLLERAAGGAPTPPAPANTRAKMDEAGAVALLNIIDRTGELPLDVSFRPGSSALRSVPDQFAKVAAMMRMDESYNFRVEAPIDVPAKGTSEERRLLLRARQSAIYNALIAAGAPSSRLTIEYAADESPEEIVRARLVLK